MQPVHVALCFNDAYLKHVGPLVYALSKNNPDLDFLVHVVYKNLSDESLHTLSELEKLFPNIRFDCRYIESELINQIAVEHTDFPLETYFRLVLADVLHEVDRLLYFDVDLLINGSVRGLWELDLQGACIAGATEKDNYMYFPGHATALGLTDNNSYFSAGVLLLDLKQMRERNLPETLVKLAIENAHSLEFCDQDLLNMFFKDEVVHFDNHYGYSSWQMFNEHYQPDDIAIAHFNGQQKPWNIISYHHGDQWKFVARYRQYRREFHQLTHPDEPVVAVMLDTRQAGTYLQECLESLLSQNYQNLNIYAVIHENDTETITKLEAYQAYDNRIHLIFSDESIDSVLALAQKEEVTGQFIMGVKGTDFLASYAIEELVTLNQKYQVDILIGDYYVLNADNGVFYIRHTNSGKHSFLSKRDALSNQDDEHLGTASGKLISKSFLDSLSLTDEDKALELNLLRKLYLKANAIVYLERHLFCYRSNLESSVSLPTSPSTYDTQIRAIQQALMDNYLLELPSNHLETRLKELLRRRQQLESEALDATLEKQLALLKLVEEPR